MFARFFVTLLEELANEVLRGKTIGSQMLQLWENWRLSDEGMVVGKVQREFQG